MRFSRSLLALFTLAYEVADRLPRKGDPLLTWGIKLLAIAKCTHRAYYGNVSAKAELIERYALQRKVSAALVTFLEDGGVLASLEQRRFALSEEEEWIEVIDTQGGRLFLIDWRYRREHISSEIYHTKGFQFAPLLAKVWEFYKNSVYVSYGEYDGGDVPLFSVLPPCADILSPTAEARIAELQTRPRKRTYLALGIPGSGKTSLTRRFAEVCGGRLLKLDASCLDDLEVQDLHFLLDTLSPEVVVVDDFDQAPFDRIKAKLLFLLESLHGKTTLFLTANSVEAVDGALLRAGRIDEILDFIAPAAEERKWFFTKLLTVAYDEAALLTATEGYSQADLVTLCECARATPLPEAIAMIDRIRAVAAEGEGAPQRQDRHRSRRSRRVPPPVY